MGNMVRKEQLHPQRSEDEETVEQIIVKCSTRHEWRLFHHVNVETIQFLHNTAIERKLKGRKPFELME